MAKHSRIQVASKMKKQGMGPLFYHNDIDVAITVVKACYDGGSRLLEFTHRGDFAQDVFNDL